MGLCVVVWGRVLCHCTVHTLYEGLSRAIRVYMLLRGRVLCLWDVHYSMGTCAVPLGSVRSYVCRCHWGLHFCVGTCAVPSGCACSFGDMCHGIGCLCSCGNMCCAIRACVLLWGQVPCCRAVHTCMGTCAVPSGCAQCHPHASVGTCAMSLVCVSSYGAVCHTIGAVTPPSPPPAGHHVGDNQAFATVTSPKQPPCLLPMDVPVMRRELLNYQPPSQLLSRGTLETMGSDSLWARGHRWVPNPSGITGRLGARP